MSDEQKSPAPISPGKASAKDARRDKLAEALRANLRRRKTASTQGSEQEGQGRDA